MIIPITSAIPPGIAPVRCFATAGPTSADTTPVVILMPSAHLVIFVAMMEHATSIIALPVVGILTAALGLDVDLTAIATPIARYNATPTVTVVLVTIVETTTCATALDAGLTQIARVALIVESTAVAGFHKSVLVGTTALKASSVPQMVVVT